MNPAIFEIISETPVASSVFLIFIALSLYTMFKNQTLLYQLMLHPFSFSKGERVYTLISSGFIHADIGHLLFNSVTFLFFSFPLERTVGSFSFFLIYFLSLILSDVPTIIRNRKNPDYRSLGASGAISGVLFSFIIFYPTTQISMLLFPIGIPAYLFAVLYTVYCIWADKKGWGNINHNAHLWGGLIGFAFTAILYPNYFFDFIGLFTEKFN